MELTQAQKNRIAYNDKVIKEMKTDEDIEKEEKKEHKNRMIKRSKVLKEVDKVVRNEEKRVFINHLNSFILEKDITEEMEEKEQELSELLFTN